MSDEFKDPFEDPPDWGDGGPVLVKIGGQEIRGNLFIDCWFNGEDEIPSPQLTLSDDSTPSFWDVDGWKRVDENP